MSEAAHRPLGRRRDFLPRVHRRDSRPVPGLGALGPGCRVRNHPKAYGFPSATVTYVVDRSETGSGLGGGRSSLLRGRWGGCRRRPGAGRALLGGFLPRVARASSYPGSSVLKQASPQADSRSSQSPKAGPGK